MIKTPYDVDPEDNTSVYVDDELSIGRYVVCAASRYNDLVICGARHHDKVMNTQIRLLRSLGHIMPKIGEQGFIDQFGKFLTREDALAIVNSNKQPLRENPWSKELFSENLY